jgi:hypothetical protein
MKWGAAASAVSASLPGVSLGRLCTALTATSAAVLLAGCASQMDRATPGATGPVRLSVDSSVGPQWVSGGDALVRVSGGMSGGDVVRLRVNGASTTTVFTPDPQQPDSRVGLVTGLRDGGNLLEAEVLAAGGSSAVASAQLQVRNHPRAGPMFSGPWETPFVCQTNEFRIYPDGPVLGPPKDAHCSADTRVDFVYRDNNAGKFLPLPVPGPVPVGAASLTTTDGRTVPYVVRIETGTVNRAIYQTAVLHDPTREAAPSPTTRPSGWNGRLIYTFGGGCPGGWYKQGATTGGVLDHNILKQGYAMASSSLNVFGNNCQDVTAAESMAMVKERFVETYGRPRRTIGWGCSGGSYQQYQIVDNYPGLLDGILPGCSFPEVMFATTHFMTDVRLLGHYFREIVPGTFGDAQQKAVAGLQNVATMYNPTAYEGALRIAPDRNCPAELQEAQRYDKVRNRTGVRCDIYGHTVNSLGRDPATGFARRPLDNVGIQYGLQALNDRLITVEQFLDLNERVGGYDADAGFQASRNIADAEAMRAAYETGRLTNGGGGLAETPIIEYRAYVDDKAGDVHVRYHSFSMRERLIKANGNADNLVMLHEDGRHGLYVSDSALLMRALSEMDQWIGAIQADERAGTKREKVLRNKPPSLREGCNSRDAQPAFIEEEMSLNGGRCAALYPAPVGPRGAAGLSIAGDVIKCQLKPVSARDYTVELTPEQLAKLRRVFPSGTCNWSQSGEQQRKLKGTWLTY